MFSRITSYAMDPSKIDEIMSILDGVRGKIDSTPGLIQMINSVDRSSGKGVVVSVYPDEETANNALEYVKDIWSSFGDYLLAAPEISSGEVIHQFHK